MTKCTTIALISIFSFFSNNLLGQNFTLNTDSLIANTAVKKTSISQLYSISKPNNELEFIIFTLFTFYKEFISSQDDNACNFHPSCSVYTMHAIQKKGSLRGILMSFDRLTRCNGLNRDDYEIYDNQLLYDPVL